MSAAPVRASRRAGDQIFCALDTPDLGAAEALARRLAGAVGGMKLGLEFFIAQGPAGVRKIAAAGLPVFLDLKLHDIPNTVAGAVRSAAALDAAMLTVHCQGGQPMLQAAVEAARQSKARPKILGVTVLTSLDDSDLSSIGLQTRASDLVARLAELARKSGCDGVVCSPAEVERLRGEHGPDFLLVAPGVRPANARIGDQKRMDTPANAIRNGANYLVIGRPITQAPDPLLAARAIADEMQAAIPAVH